jgi:hypothetical protein
LLEVTPGLREQLVEGIRLQDARGALRRVLRLRQIALGPDDETRIDACNDLTTLERWQAKAIVAANAVEALG